MKELIHFSMTGSTVCEDMKEELKKFIKSNPDVVYSQVLVDKSPELYHYYLKKYPIDLIPSFLGFVDDAFQDGHSGEATELILSSLVN
jgi:hypothetical protein